MFIAAAFLCVALLTIDWRQTLYIALNPATRREMNPILGLHPSVARVCVYFAAWIAITIAINVFAHAWASAAYDTLIAIIELWAVIHNYRRGIRL